MQNALKPNEFEDFVSLKLLKVKYGSGEPNNLPVLQNWFPPKKLGPPPLICWNLKKLRKVLLNHPEAVAT